MSSQATRKEYVMVAINEDDTTQVEEEKNEKKVDQIGYDELLKRKKEMFDPSIADDDDEDDDEASFYKQPKKDIRKEVPSRDSNRGGWCQDFTRALTGR